MQNRLLILMLIFASNLSNVAFSFESEDSESISNQTPPTTFEQIIRVSSCAQIVREIHSYKNNENGFPSTLTICYLIKEDRRGTTNPVIVQSPKTLSY